MTTPDALPASKEAAAVCDAFDVLSLSEAYGGSGATSVSSKDLNALERAVKALRAALSSAIPAGDGVPPDNWAADRQMLADAANDLSLSDGAVRSLCVARVGEITPEIKEWASTMLSTASTSGKG